MKFIVFLLLSSQTFAQNIVDLGNLEISGEVRRPMMEYIDSDTKNRKVIVNLLKEEVLNIEEKLTKEKTIKVKGMDI